MSEFMHTEAPLKRKHDGCMIMALEDSKILSEFPEEQVVSAIGTHDGTFHCDEALAVAMLKSLPQFEKSVIIRSRDPALLEKCEIIVDVGAEYDPERLRFDHHQKTFSGVFDGFSTKLSSAGLVYKHYGKELVTNFADGSLPEAAIDLMYKKVYEDFIEAVDGIDNGIEPYSGERRFKMNTDLSSRVRNLNADWNEEFSSELSNEKFKQAMKLTGGEFFSCLSGLIHSWWPARSIVQEAFEGAQNVHPSGAIIKLDPFCPWKAHLFDVEKEHGAEGQVKYVLYSDYGKSWRIQAVPLEDGGFSNRLPLPTEWCGLRDDVLAEKVGSPGAIFVHASGFIGGHKLYEGALQMAVLALEMQQQL